jgi:hypothetical protein
MTPPDHPGLAVALAVAGARRGRADVPRSVAGSGYRPTAAATFRERSTPLKTGVGAGGAAPDGGFEAHE